MLGQLGPSHNPPCFLPTSSLAFPARSPGHTCGYASLYVQVLATPQQSPPVLSQVSLGQVHTRANVCPREGRPDGQALEEDLGLCKQGISATWRIIWEVGWGTMGPGPGEGTAGGQNEVRSWALLLGFMLVSSSGYLRCLILIQARILLPLDS